MDACLITILIVGIFIILMVVLIVVIGRRKKLLCSIPNRNVMSYRQEMLNKFTNRGYRIKERDNGNVFVQKDSFSATTLVLKQNGPNVDVLFIHSNSSLLLALIIILIFTIWIIGIILALIADSNSKSFRNDELKPLLSGYETGRICPNCSRQIPMDANICPYCAKQFTQYV